MQSFATIAIWAENWLCPFWGIYGGELSPHLTQCGLGRGDDKFRLDPSNPTVLPQYTKIADIQDRQRSDSIGRTVLQTVAQNAYNCLSLHSRPCAPCTLPDGDLGLLKARLIRHLLTLSLTITLTLSLTLTIHPSRVHTADRVYRHFIVGLYIAMTWPNVGAAIYARNLYEC